MRTTWQTLRAIIMRWTRTRNTMWTSKVDKEDKSKGTLVNSSLININISLNC